MSVGLIPEQEAAVCAIVAEMIAGVLHGAGDRIADAISGSIVLLPVIHAERDATGEARHHV